MPAQAIMLCFSLVGILTRLARVFFRPEFFQIFIKFLGAGVLEGTRGVFCGGQLYKVLQSLNCGYETVLLHVAATLTVFGWWGYGGVAR